MADTRTPDFLFNVFQRSNGAQRTFRSFCVGDIFHDVLDGSDSDYSDLLAAGEWNDYVRLSNGLSVENVGFMAFMPDGTVSRKPSRQGGVRPPSGFYALPQKAVQDLDFDKKDGSWVKVPLPDNTAGSAVYNDGEESVQRVELPALKKNQPHEFEITFWGQPADDERPEYLKRLGVNLRLALRQGIPPSLETMTGPDEEGQEQWANFKTMDKFGPFSPLGATIKCSLRHIGGRAVWQMNEHALWLLDSTSTKAASSTATTEKGPKKLEWGEAPIQIEVKNMRTRVGLSYLQHSTTAVSRVSRTVPIHSVPNTPFSAPMAGGHQPYGTELQMEDPVIDGNQATYSVTLKPSDDGLSAPLLSVYQWLRFPVWTTPLHVSPINITPAVKSCNITLAAPPLQAGAEGQVEIDIPLLKKLFPSTAADILRNYLKDESPIEISARWKDASGDPIGSRDGLFRGYLMGTTGDETGWNAATLSFQLRDPIVRLQGSLARIDGTCGALDYILYNRLKQYQAAADADYGVTGNTATPLTKRQKSLYGADCVKEIIAHFLGPYEAGRMNGDGTALRFTPADHPPLLDSSDCTGSLLAVASVFGNELASGSLNMQNGFFFPPPYGADSDALGWINKFAADEGFVGFYGYIDRDTDVWPCFNYVNYEMYLRSAAIWPIEGDVMAQIGFETRPENNITRAIVWGSPFGQAPPHGHPSVFQGEALRLPGRWERTKIAENNMVTSDALARLFAEIILTEAYEPTGVQWPSFDFRGKGQLQVGDIFTTAASRELAKVNDVYLRGARITHSYTCGESTGTDWKTKVALQTLSRTQLIAFYHAHPELTTPFPT